MQEALTNVVKHAGAEHVSIVIARRDGQVVATIDDDGRGFDVDDVRDDALGLLGMRERLTLVGGRLDRRVVAAGRDDDRSAGAAAGSAEPGRRRRERRSRSEPAPPRLARRTRRRRRDRASARQSPNRRGGPRSITRVADRGTGDESDRPARRERQPAVFDVEPAGREDIVKRHNTGKVDLMAHGKAAKRSGRRRAAQKICGLLRHALRQD